MKTRKKYIFAFVSALFVSAIACAHEYKVSTNNGVPFLNVDGQNVRGRMFYGNVPGSRYMDIDRRPKKVSVKFSAPRDTDNGQIRMNFGAAIGNVWISEISLLDRTENKSVDVYDFDAEPFDKRLKSNWTQKALEAWRDVAEKETNTPPDPKYDKQPFELKNENGALRIKKEFVDMTIPSNQGKIHDIERLNFYIGGLNFKAGHKYTLNFKLNADRKGRFDTIVYDPLPFSVLGQNARESFMTQEKYAAEKGVNFVTFGVPAFWDENDPSYPELVDKRFKPVIAANPNVKIIVRLGLEPPEKWLDAHTDILMKEEGGKIISRMHVRFPSPSSEQYRRDAIAAMKRFIKYVEEKYPDNIAGYHPSGGNSSEWFYGASYGNFTHSGYDAATVKAWRKWLSKKYGSDKSLQTAWNKPDVSLATVKVPPTAERAFNARALFDPASQQNTIDFNVFLNDEMSDIVLLAAKTIRETAPARRLSVMFYGYGIGFSSMPKGPAYSGHYSFRKLLDSEYIDVFTAPINYKDRQFGGPKLCVSPAESAPLSGKLWLDEDDNRTWLAPFSGSPPYVLDKLQTCRKDSVKVMRRNMGQQVAKNNASWWMDLFGCGWFADRQLWNVFDDFKSAEDDMLAQPVLYKPEVALSYDELSMCHIAGQPSAVGTTAQCVGNIPDVLTRSGAPHGQYLLDDILEGRATPKLNWFGGAFALTKLQREQMRKVAGNSACVYLWATGLVDLDSKKFSLEAVRDATGFEVEYAGDTEIYVLPTEAGSKIGLKEFGYKMKVAPLLSPIPQKGDTILGTYPNGKPAVLLRTSGKHPQLFFGSTKVSQQLCDFMVKIAGVHKYADNEAVASANEKYLSVNATKDGMHTIALPDEREVFDVFENKNLGRLKTMKFDLKRGDVKFFKLSK